MVNTSSAIANDNESITKSQFTVNLWKWNHDPRSIISTNGVVCAKIYLIKKK